VRQKPSSWRASPRPPRSPTSSTSSLRPPNAAGDLVKAGKLEEAEAAAHDLLKRFPDVHDGWDRLGMVHEARGEKKQAADCYRKALAVIRAQPENYDPEFGDAFVELITKLDPTVAA